MKYFTRFWLLRRGYHLWGILKCPFFCYNICRKKRCGISWNFNNLSNFFYFFIIFMFIFYSLNFQGSHNFFNLFISFFIIHGTVMIIVLGLLIYYLFAVFKSNFLDSNQKILWAILLVLGNIISMVVYYFVYIFPFLRKSREKNG